MGPPITLHAVMLSPITTMRFGAATHEWVGAASKSPPSVACAAAPPALPPASPPPENGSLLLHAATINGIASTSRRMSLPPSYGECEDADAGPSHAVEEARSRLVEDRAVGTGVARRGGCDFALAQEQVRDRELEVEVVGADRLRPARTDGDAELVGVGREHAEVAVVDRALIEDETGAQRERALERLGLDAEANGPAVVPVVRDVDVVEVRARRLEQVVLVDDVDFEALDRRPPRVVDVERAADVGREAGRDAGARDER